MSFAIAIFVLTAPFAEPGTPAARDGHSKPACAVPFVGKLWPDEANRDTKALRLAVQTGGLELCGKQRDGYRWESLSVNVQQLRAAEAAGPLDATQLDAAPAGDVSDSGPAPARNEAGRRSRHRFQAIRRVLGMQHSPVP